MSHHQQLLDWIENELVSQNLHLGDHLPDDRELARRVGIAQSHMREILKSCEEIGILRLYEGKRKSILSELVREPAVIAGPAMGLYLASSTHPQRDLVQTCLLLETHAVTTVPYDRSALPELDRLLTQMADPQIIPADFHALEADFHIQLGRLSGNTLISALLASMRAAMIEIRLDLMGRVPLWSSTAARLRTEHRAIVDAVRSGDPALARTLVESNIMDRFTEAKIDVNRERPVEKPAEITVIAPVDIEDKDLVPESWESTISPDLFNALKNIQPKTVDSEGSTAASTSELPDTGAVDVAPAPQAVSQEEVWKAVRPEPVQSTVLRATPSQGGRKRRGTVSAVHGGVIKPAAQKDAPDLEKFEAELRAEKDRLAAEKAEAERLEAERRAEEERLAAERRAEEERAEKEQLEAKLRAEEERLAALEAAREQEARELEEKLRAEEELLAALADRQKDTQEPESSATEVAGATVEDSAAPVEEPVAEEETTQTEAVAEDLVREEASAEGELEPAQEDSTETSSSEEKIARSARRRFDLAGYFGFRQPARATFQKVAEKATEPEPQTSDLPLPAGYEPAEGEPAAPIYIDETAPEPETPTQEDEDQELVEVTEPQDAAPVAAEEEQEEPEKPVISKAQRRSNSGKKKKGKKKRR